MMDKPPNEATEAKSMPRLAGFIAFSMILAVAVAMNWCYVYVEKAVTQSGDFSAAAIDQTTGPVRIRMSGFPWRYQHHITLTETIVSERDESGLETVELRPVSSSYDGRLLIANGVVWFVIGLFAFWIVTFRVRAESESMGRRRLGDVLLVAFIFGLPISFFLYHFVIEQKHKRLANQIGNRGACLTSAWLPEIVADQIPAPLIDRMQRVRVVSVRNPSSELMRDILKAGTISSLNVSRANFLDEVASLPKTPTLTKLSISRSSMSGKLSQWLESNPQLVTLGMYGNEVDEDAISAISKLPNLQSLSFSNSVVDLKRLRDLACKSVLKSLTIAVGIQEGEEFVASDFPVLEEIQLYQRNSKRQKWATKIKLSNLPQLQIIRCDILRHYDFQLEDLPLLQSVAPRNPNDTMDGRSSESTTLVVFDRLVIKRCPLLEELNLMLPSNQVLDIKESQGLQRITLGSFNASLSGMVYRVDTPPEQVQKVVDEIGDTSSLREIRFVAVSLEGIDLKPLAKNQKLHTLSFFANLITQEQIFSLGEMAKLKKLDLNDCLVDQSGFINIRKQFPKLDHFVCDLKNAKELSFPDGIPFRNLKSPPLIEIEKFVLGPSEENEFGLALGAKLKTLKISDSLRLRGLAIDGFVPEDTSLGAFRDLQFFKVAGPVVDDDFLNSFAECDNLEELMVAYSSVSTEGFQKLGKYTELRSLVVPGAQLSDEVIHAWTPIRRLWNLDLSDASIPPTTVGWLAKNPSLRFVKLDHSKFQPKSIEQLAGLEQLTHLSLANVGLTSRQLERICNLSLDYLNLSGTTLQDDHLEVIQQAESPAELVVNHCNLKLEQIVELAQNRPELVVGVDRKTYRDLLVFTFRDKRTTAPSWWNRIRENGELHSLKHAKSKLSLISYRDIDRKWRKALIEKGIADREAFLQAEAKPPKPRKSAKPSQSSEKVASTSIKSETGAKSKASPEISDVSIKSSGADLKNESSMGKLLPQDEKTNLEKILESNPTLKEKAVVSTKQAVMPEDWLVGDTRKIRRLYLDMLKKNKRSDPEKGNRQPDPGSDPKAKAETGTEAEAGTETEAETGTETEATFE